MRTYATAILACLALAACESGGSADWPDGPYIAVVGTNGGQSLSAQAYETIDAQVVVANVDDIQALGFTVHHDDAVEILEWSINDGFLGSRGGKVLPGPSQQHKNRLDLSVATSQPVGSRDQSAVVNLKLRTRDESTHVLTVDVLGNHKGIINSTGERVTLTSVSTVIN